MLVVGDIVRLSSEYVATREHLRDVPFRITRYSTTRDNIAYVVSVCLVRREELTCPVHVKHLCAWNVAVDGPVPDVHGVYPCDTRANSLRKVLSARRRSRFMDVEQRANEDRARARDEMMAQLRVLAAELSSGIRGERESSALLFEAYKRMRRASQTLSGKRPRGGDDDAAFVEHYQELLDKRFQGFLDETPDLTVADYVSRDLVSRHTAERAGRPDDAGADLLFHSSQSMHAYLQQVNLDSNVFHCTPPTMFVDDTARVLHLLEQIVKSETSEMLRGVPLATGTFKLTVSQVLTTLLRSTPSLDTYSFCVKYVAPSPKEPEEQQLTLSLPKGGIPSCIIDSPPGTGKTVQCLATMWTILTKHHLALSEFVSKQAAVSTTPSGFLSYQLGAKVAPLGVCFVPEVLVGQWYDAAKDVSAAAAGVTVLLRPDADVVSRVAASGEPTIAVVAATAENYAAIMGNNPQVCISVAAYDESFGVPIGTRHMASYSAVCVQVFAQATPQTLMQAGAGMPKHPFRRIMCGHLLEVAHPHLPFPAVHTVRLLSMNVSDLGVKHITAAEWVRIANQFLILRVMLVNRPIRMRQISESAQHMPPSVEIVRIASRIDSLGARLGVASSDSAFVELAMPKIVETKAVDYLPFALYSDYGPRFEPFVASLRSSILNSSLMQQVTTSLSLLTTSEGSFCIRPERVQTMVAQLLPKDDDAAIDVSTLVAMRIGGPAEANLIRRQDDAFCALVPMHRELRTALYRRIANDTVDSLPFMKALIDAQTQMIVRRCVGHALRLLGNQLTGIGTGIDPFTLESLFGEDGNVSGVVMTGCCLTPVDREHYELWYQRRSCCPVCKAPGGEGGATVAVVSAAGSSEMESGHLNNILEALKDKSLPDALMAVHEKKLPPMVVLMVLLHLFHVEDANPTRIVIGIDVGSEAGSESDMMSFSALANAAEEAIPGCVVKGTGGPDADNVIREFNNASFARPIVLVMNVRDKMHFLGANLYGGRFLITSCDLTPADMFQLKSRCNRMMTHNEQRLTRYIAQIVRDTTTATL